jgi:hypothetical protein
LKVLYKKLVLDLVFFNIYIILYYNIRYNIELIFKKRDKIYFLQKNIEIKQPNLKLDYKKLKLFKIKKIIKFVNYKLIFLKTMNIYLIFYIFFKTNIIRNINSFYYRNIVNQF